MAPEQLEGREADGRTDIFAFGAVLYEMATGRKAFSGASQASLISSILRDDPQPISQLLPMSPPALDRVVKTCLAKDPEERWQSAADLRRELRWIAESSQAGVPAAASLSAAKAQSGPCRRDRAAWPGPSPRCLCSASCISQASFCACAPSGLSRSTRFSSRRKRPPSA